MGQVRRGRGSSDAGARLHVRLLGEASVTLDGAPIPDLSTPRVQRLLARLAVAPDVALRRDRLAWELWPDSTDAQALTNLRKLLHDLRRWLPDLDTFLEVGPLTVRWQPDGPVAVDVIAFTRNLDRDDAATAVAHYGGDLAPGCDDEWVVVQRERLRRLAVEALARLAGDAHERGDHHGAVDHARRLLELDPLHEPAHRLLIAALAGRGDRGEALRAYHRCVELLARELGVTPEPATTGLYDRIRRPAPADPPAPAAPDPVLVGRAGEWRAARAAWETATRGQAHLLLVTGEAGIGKTRLVEELARWVTAGGHAVARTRAYEAAGRLPWGAATGWLRSPAVWASLDQLDAAWLTELAPLLPELRSAHPGLPDTSPTTDVSRRHQLLEAVRRGLTAGGRPLLLVVDDLQWCDTETLELCGYLIRTQPTTRVLVAATARDDEVNDDHLLAQLQRRLARDAAVTTLALDRLDPDDTAVLARAAGLPALDDDGVARLWKETEGNPLFVVEAVRAGFTSGDETPRAALTPTVEAVIATRLGRLSTDARRLLEVAATIGREFTPDVLARASGVTEDELADALDEVWHRRIVREHGAAYDFGHDLLRAAVLESISPARRRKLHRSVAAALEEHHAGDLGPVSARLAEHYRRAGLRDRALAAYEQAAEHAWRVFALDDGIAMLQQELRLLDESPRSTAREETELRLLSALGVALVARYGYGALAVQQCYERIVSLHRRLGRPPSAATLRGLALLAVARCDFDRTTELGHQLLAVGVDDHTATVEGQYVLGVAAFWRGEFAAAERHLVAAIGEYRDEESALHIARYAQDPKAVCLCRLAMNHVFRGKADEAERTMAAALAYADELDHPMTTGYVRGFHAIVAALASDGHDLPAAVAALEAVADRMHIGYFQAVARFLRSWTEVLAGDLASITPMTETVDWWRREQPLHLTVGLSLLARARLQAGDVAGGRAAVADALAWTHRTNQRYLLAELLRIDAALLAAGGDPAGAADAVRQATAVASAQGSPWLLERIRATAAEAPVAIT